MWHAVNPATPQFSLETRSSSNSLNTHLSDLAMASSSAAPNNSKFKLFSRARARSPTPNPRKREPPPVLALGPPSPQSRWEAESDGDAQEFYSQETLEENTTPVSRVRTAPATLPVRTPSPIYPQYPHTVGPTHRTEFLAPSPHPFSANYERQSQESDRDQYAGVLQRARDTNRRRPVPNPRGKEDIRIKPRMRGASLDPRQRGEHAMVVAPPRDHGSPNVSVKDNRIKPRMQGASLEPRQREEHAMMVAPPRDHGSPNVSVEDASAVAGPEEVDLDGYTWYILHHDKLKDLKKGTTEGYDYSLNY